MNQAQASSNTLPHVWQEMEEQIHYWLKNEKGRFAHNQVEKHQKPWLFPTLFWIDDFKKGNNSYLCNYWADLEVPYQVS